jgi:hypothetical protein
MLCACVGRITPSSHGNRCADRGGRVDRDAGARGVHRPRRLRAGEDELSHRRYARYDVCYYTLMLAGCSNVYVLMAVVMLGPARQRAAELDAEFAATKKLRGPLHGVPVSD